MCRPLYLPGHRPDRAGQPRIRALSTAPGSRRAIVPRARRPNRGPQTRRSCPPICPYSHPSSSSSVNTACRVACREACREACRVACALCDPFCVPACAHRLRPVTWASQNFARPSQIDTSCSWDGNDRSAPRSRRAHRRHRPDLPHRDQSPESAPSTSVSAVRLGPGRKRITTYSRGGRILIEFRDPDLTSENIVFSEVSR